jgi:hypothetical protein
MVGVHLWFDLALSQVPVPVKVLFSASFLRMYFPFSDTAVFHIDKVIIQSTISLKKFLDTEKDLCEINASQ